MILTLTLTQQEDAYSVDTHLGRITITRTGEHTRVWRYDARGEGVQEVYFEVTHAPETDVLRLVVLALLHLLEAGDV